MHIRRSWQAVRR